MVWGGGFGAQGIAFVHDERMSHLVERFDRGFLFLATRVPDLPWDVGDPAPAFVADPGDGRGGAFASGRRPGLLVVNSSLPRFLVASGVWHRDVWTQTVAGVTAEDLVAAYERFEMVLADLEPLVGRHPLARPARSFWRRARAVIAAAVRKQPSGRSGPSDVFGSHSTYTRHHACTRFWPRELNIDGARCGSPYGHRRVGAGGGRVRAATAGPGGHRDGRRRGRTDADPRQIWKRIYDGFGAWLDRRRCRGPGRQAGPGRRHPG